MMTGVPSGSVPVATALTPPSWPRSGSPTGVPSAVRHTRTVQSLAAADDDRVPSGSVPAATASTRRRGRSRLADRGAVGGPPHPHRAIESCR